MKRIVFFTVITLVTCGAGLLAQEPANEPEGLAIYTLKMDGFEWITKSSEHFRVHYLPGSTAERQIDILIAEKEASLASQLAILEVEQYDRVIDLFYFDSREQIEQTVSKPFRALVDAESMTVLAVRNDEEIARDAHEIMHVVSFDLWGGWDRQSELAWLCEGLATYGDKPCNGYEMSELAAHVLKNTEDSVPLETLATRFRMYPEMIGYVLMESFVAFALDSYGLKHLRNLWIEGYDGFERVFGKDVATVEQEWHKYVDRKYPDPEVADWSSLKEHGCK